MNEIRILPAVRTGQAGVSKFREIQEATSFGAASLYDLPFLYAGIFLLRFRLDSGRYLGAILHLRVRSRGRYRPPCLATRHSECQSDANNHD